MTCSRTSHISLGVFCTGFCIAHYRISRELACCLVSLKKELNLIRQPALMYSHLQSHDNNPLKPSFPASGAGMACAHARGPAGESAVACDSGQSCALHALQVINLCRCQSGAEWTCTATAPESCLGATACILTNIRPAQDYNMQSAEILALRIPKAADSRRSSRGEKERELSTSSQAASM